MKSVISVKAMIETYVKFEISEETWQMFYNMRLHNLISDDTWTAFYNKCKGWAMADSGNAVIDTDNNDKVIYIRDGEGYLVKA